MPQPCTLNLPQEENGSSSSPVLQNRRFRVYGAFPLRVGLILPVQGHQQDNSVLSLPALFPALCLPWQCWAGKHQEDGDKQLFVQQLKIDLS